MDTTNDKMTRWAQILAGRVRIGDPVKLPKASALHISLRDRETGAVVETGAGPMPETIYGKIRVSTHAESSRKGFPDSQNPECMEHYQRGVEMGRENRMEEAVEEMVLALEADPTYLWARVNAGAYLYLLGGDKLDLAEKVLKEATREAQRAGFEGIAEVAAVNLMALNIDKFRMSGSEKVELLAKTYSFVEKLLKRPQEPMFVLHAAAMLLMLGRHAEARALIVKAKRLKGYETTARHLRAEYPVLQGVA